MRRTALITLLAIGTLGGYAAGFASLRCHSAHRRNAFEHHMAQLCVDAARGEPPVAKGTPPKAVQLNPGD